MTRKDERKRGTIDDVAREASVSRSTASRVLRDLMKVTPETRDRIFAAAEKVAYRPNVMARALRIGVTPTLAVMLSARQLASEHYGDAIVTLKQVLAAKGMKLIVSVTDDGDDLNAAMEDLIGFCGVIALPASLGADPSATATLGIPVILLDWSPTDKASADQSAGIGFDDADGIRQAVEHLVSLGHRNIAFMGRAGRGHDAVREQGFRAAMKDALLPVRPEWTLRCMGDENDASNCFEQAISGARSRLSAIICASDELAMEVMTAIRRRGERVPDDFSVIGYGNGLGSRLSQPQLTTVGHNGRKLGSALAQAAIAQLEGNDSPGRVTLPAQLMLRDTTAPRRSLASLAISVIDRSSAAATPHGGLADGIYELQAMHSGMMLDVPNMARTPGCHVWQWQRNGTTAQLWHIAHADEIWYRMRNIGNWLYLDADASMPDTCPVVTNPINETNPEFQLWKFEPMSPGSTVHRITNKAKDLVVDFAYGSLVSNELVIVFPWNGNACQQWALGSIPLLTDEYEIVALHSAKALSVPGQSRAAGATPCQAERARSLGQRWRLIHRGAAHYQIQSMLSNLMLQAVRQPDPRAVLMQNDPEAGDAQLWRIEVADAAQSSYRFVSKVLDLVLEIRDAQHSDGAALQLAGSSDGPHQQWLVYDDDSESAAG